MSIAKRRGGIKLNCEQLEAREVPSVSLQSSNPFANYGVDVAFTAIVQTEAGSPSGSVAFSLSNGLTATVPLDNEDHANFDPGVLGAGSYTVTAVYSGDSSDPLTETISPVGLDVSATVADKYYDGTTTATVSSLSLSGALAGDDVSAGYANASFSDKNVGVAKTVTVDGLYLSGTAAANYTLNDTSTSTTASINALGTTNYSEVGVDKIYDGGTSTSVTSLTSTQVLPGDDVSFSYTDAEFSDKNVGSAKTVNVNGIAISGGADAGNYTIDYSTTSCSANITPLSIFNVSATADDKIYDGGTTATVSSITSTDVVSGDNVIFGYTDAEFSDPAVGYGKTVSVNGINISGGADAGNYTLNNTSTTTNAGIKVASTTNLVSSLNPATYGDQVTFTATVSASSGTGTPTGSVLFEDGSTVLAEVALDGSAVAAFTTTSALAAGSHSIVAIFEGDAYFGVSSASLTEIVGRAHLTVTANNQFKVYGDVNPALTATISGFANGENLSTSGVTGTSSLTTSTTTASGVGSYTIAVGAGTLAASNYDFPSGNLVNGTLTILPALLTVVADDKQMMAHNPVPTLTGTVTGLVNGDTVYTLAVSFNTSTTSLSPAGMYPITGSIANGANYAVNLVNGALAVIQGTYWVDNLGDAGTGDLTTSTGDLRWCIQQANTNPGFDIIKFVATLKGTITLNSALPVITDGVLITGNGQTTVTRATNAVAFRIFEIKQVSATFENMTISNGKASGVAPDSGGGILNDQGFLMLTNCTVTDCGADSFGGGIYSTGSLSVKFCTVINNTAGLDGGGIAIRTTDEKYLSTVNLIAFSEIGHNVSGHNGGGVFMGALSNGVGVYFQVAGTVLDSKIHDNLAQNGGGVAIAGTNSWLQISGDSVTNNAATVDGGGIWVSQGRLDSLFTSVTHNETAADGRGGAIYMDSGAGLPLNPPKVNLTGGDISENVSGDGGGLFRNGGTFTAAWVDFNLNIASNRGGGAFIYDGNASISGGLIRNNQAPFGDGVLVNLTLAALAQPQLPAYFNNLLIEIML